MKLCFITEAISGKIGVGHNHHKIFIFILWNRINDRSNNVLICKGRNK